MPRGLNIEQRHVGFRSRTDLQESQESAGEVRLAVARAKQGDRDALRFLYLRYCDNVYGYVCSIVRDPGEAEDITQHVFMKLITVIGKYEDCGVPFSGWLLRLARNAALDHLRRRRATPSEEVFAGGGHEDQHRRERVRDLRVALEALPAEQREVVLMRHLVGLSPPEIARRLGRSESSIHGLHHRGRRALQRELAQLGWAPVTGVDPAGRRAC
jgi:RNA polymerase sigma-70 factor (ECF subfamily)